MNQRSTYEARLARGEMERASGRRYPAFAKELESLSPEALTDLRRLIRDLDDKATSERNKRRRGQFW